MSVDFKNFCRAVLKEIELEVSSNSGWFRINNGLCFNSYYYDEQFGTNTYRELMKLIDFEPFPFNDELDYFVESANKSLFKNKKRLAFLHKHANLDI